MATQEDMFPQVPLVYICYGLTEELHCFDRDLEFALQRNKVCVNSFLRLARILGAIRFFENPFKEIEQSRIALVIFSSMCTTKSRWCFEELMRIKELGEVGKLVVIPIFYKLTVTEMDELRGEFGDNYRNLVKGTYGDKLDQWKQALRFVLHKSGLVCEESSDNFEVDFINAIVREVKSVITENSGNSLFWDRETNRYPKVADIILREAKSRRDDGLNLTSQLGMIIGCLLLLFFCLQHTAYMSTPFSGEGGAIDRIVENVPKVPEYIPAERTENIRDKFTEVPTCIYEAKPETSSSNTKTNDDSLDRTCSSSPMGGKVKPPNIQVFINFRGDQLRNNFVGYLVDALRRSGINVFIDNHEQRGEDLNTLFKRIECSGIAIVVFSSRYTESKWCLDELVKIKERVHQGLLKVLPIFYKVTPGNVKRLKGEFGDNFRDKEYIYASDERKIKRWKEAIVFVSHKFALTFDEKSVLEIDFIETIVKEVLKMLQAISTVESGQSSR